MKLKVVILDENYETRVFFGVKEIYCDSLTSRFQITLVSGEKIRFGNAKEFNAYKDYEKGERDETGD